jgi:hypothetical protein
VLKEVLESIQKQVKDFKNLITKIENNRASVKKEFPWIEREYRLGLKCFRELDNRVSSLIGVQG